MNRKHVLTPSIMRCQKEVSPYRLERGPIHITFNTVYSVLLLIIINFLLCLIYKLTFITGMSV